jgi:UDP:flavonoid glycosyltransferase YjiC (YdhE family)
MLNKQRILIVPLDWGLGHASRCMPIIKRMVEVGHVVILASNGRSKELLKRTFPNLEFTPDPPDYSITYPSKGSFALHLGKQIPQILKSIEEEEIWAKQICKEYKIDQIISDNRYGLHSSECTSVIITHQTSPRFPWLIRWYSNRYFKKWNEQFDYCWIPDEKPIERSFGGALSHKNVPKNAHYIGILSRFTNQVYTASTDYSVVVLISGPEPQRSIFHEKMKRRFEGKATSVLMVCGTPENRNDNREANIREVSHMEDEVLAPFLKGAELVISRSGYSSIMDFAALGLKNVEYHATPGQTEQEYLKKWTKKR